MRKIPLSTRVYTRAGIVDRAAINSSQQVYLSAKPHSHPASEHRGALLTAQKKRQGSQRPVLRLEALQERRQRQDIQQGVEEAGMDEGEGIRAVHYCKNNISAPKPYHRNAKAKVPDVRRSK